ncbi:coenzyme Q-binding protein COQ10 homolog B, mitochondrial [Folsomia candida]|uniref:Coenzyme Q-binding protein COQ10 B, mitochondrial n=1 Tax=Folsomia candida TaxID=158441 RepID=A0A226ELW7_FOLCA|nr:coenzyme Q-binding protein COQ10 homolog B, mitochondrial [Folsomia candida]OXA57556.1 Coenzyme Q-binding protein COQ10 B, mitochondrial [Folsomia candida]
MLFIGTCNCSSFLIPSRIMLTQVTMPVRPKSYANLASYDISHSNPCVLHHNNPAWRRRYVKSHSPLLSKLCPRTGGYWGSQQYYDKLMSPSTGLQILQTARFMSFPGAEARHKEYVERRILGFSMEQMYDVVSDVERYQEFLPWCQKSLVKTRRKTYVIADLVVGFPPLLESYTSSVTLVKPNLIRAESTQGKLFNKLITTWKFSPGLKGKPQSCVIDFYVSFEFKSALTSQLANVFFNEVVIVMVRAFYNEAKRRYGAESVPSRKINILAPGSSNNDKS